VDSVNPDMWAQIQAQNSTLVTPQRNFYDGTISNSEWSVDLDVNKDFEVGLSKPITFAFGGQYRDAYGIGSGEFGSYYSGGAQSYPGFSPSDAGVNVRRAEAAYVDFAIDPIKNLHLDLAGRYEHYSDFGSVYTGKVTARYDFSPAFALRGTVSNGFRAPTLAEEFYSSVNVGPGFVAGQFPPNSSAASALGFNKLQPEKSTNFSVGFVAHPRPSCRSLDAYEIRLRKRISLRRRSSAMTRATPTTTVSFRRPFSTRCMHAGFRRRCDVLCGHQHLYQRCRHPHPRYRGDCRLRFGLRFGGQGQLEHRLQLQPTKLQRIYPLPAQVTNTLDYSQSQLLDLNAQTGLTTATPRVKTIFNALWTMGRLSVNFRETIYGSTSQPSAQRQRLWRRCDRSADRYGRHHRPRHRLQGDQERSFRHRREQPVRQEGADRSQLQRSSGERQQRLRRAVPFTPWGINGGYYYARATFNF
jgi:iron complex outermembrane receptor protein